MPRAAIVELESQASAPETDTAERSPRSGFRDWPLLAASAAASLAIAAVAAAVLSVRVVRAGLPLGWDEAIHAVASLTLADDLRARDVVAFLRDSDQQVFYPPGFAWFQAPTFTLWQPTDQTARVSSLIGLALLALATWWLGAQLAVRARASGGFIAAALVVGSPLTLAMSTQPMIEVFNALVIAATLGTQVRFRATGRWRWTLASSTFLLLAILTKYNYAAFALATIAIDQALGGDFGRARIARTFRWFYQPLGIGLAIWFASDLAGKVRTAAGFGISQAIDANRPWWRELAYYPQALFDGGSRGILGGALVGVGLVCAVAVVRRPGSRLAWIFVATSFALISIHPNKQVRFLEPILPVILALAGAGLASIPDALRRAERASAIAVRWQHPRGRGRRSGPVATAGDEPPRHETLATGAEDDGAREVNRRRDTDHQRSHPVSARGLLSPWRGDGARIARRAALPAVSLAALVYAAIQIAGIATPSSDDVARGDAIHRAASFIAAQVPAGEPAMLVGTFADFGPYYVTWSLRGAWHVDPSRVITDYSTLPSPGLLPNGEVDSTPGPRYAAAWATWRGAHSEYWLVTLDVRRPSPFWTSEFGSANAWKQNYVAAIRDSGERPAKVLVETPFSLTVSVYPPKSAHAG